MGLSKSEHFARIIVDTEESDLTQSDAEKLAQIGVTKEENEDSCCAEVKE